MDLTDFLSVDIDLTSSLILLCFSHYFLLCYLSILSCSFYYSFTFSIMFDWAPKLSFFIGLASNWTTGFIGWTVYFFSIYNYFEIKVSIFSNSFNSFSIYLISESFKSFLVSFASVYYCIVSRLDWFLSVYYF